MRKLQRSIAKANMRMAGITNLNSRKGGSQSKFALNWREYAKGNNPLGTKK